MSIESSAKNELFLRSIKCSWKPKGNPASKSVTFAINGFFIRVKLLMIFGMDFSKFFLKFWSCSEIANETEVIISHSRSRSSRDLFKIWNETNFLFSILTYHNSNFSLKGRTWSTKSIIVLHQGCPTFFHNGPNYKFMYIRRAIKLHVSKISSF